MGVARAAAARTTAERARKVWVARAVAARATASLARWKAEVARTMADSGDSEEGKDGRGIVGAESSGGVGGRGVGGVTSYL